MNRRPHRILTLAHRLGDTCSLCHMYIEPRDILRVDWDYLRVPTLQRHLRAVAAAVVDAGCRAY
jgi:hypothetical protein